MVKRLPVFFHLTLILLLHACHSRQAANTKIEDVAANEEVARYMKAFEGKGEQPDGSLPLDPATALSHFKTASDLRIDLVLSEPSINQPVFMSFDQRGRLWVVQYNQYPYPAGLKVTSIDNHDRVTFDKIPEPPPGGARGADKISFFEDTDGDGMYDKSTDAITGLNIATSVALGRGRIWVLSPPYLLAYPDKDGNGLPDGKPEVHLRGFGIEDTHAVANSLRWGPDGWLYGAQGSTVSSSISSAVSKNISFSGQAIWRYHPATKVFEVFAEGGGNSFYIEIDEKGRLFSGDNNGIRGVYFKQGGYYYKNWGKHGGLTNPYALGFLPGMGFYGDSIRFTHAWLKYEGDNLPQRYRGAMIALNPLHGYVQLARFAGNHSNFNSTDEERILQTDDRWFRPVDVKAGPDGAVYVADWYDSRLSHVDPLDNWHKNSGRIYRLSAKNAIASHKVVDLSKYSGTELVQWLSSPNRWYREQAQRLLADRRDRSLLPQLTALLNKDSGQLALEALWAIHATGGFDDAVATTALMHADPFVRMWGIRLLGDQSQLSATIAGLLATVAAKEPHAEVRSQLAATARRLPVHAAIPVINNLLLYHDDSSDPDIPLFTWWALEAKAEQGRDAVVSLFTNKNIWARPVVMQVILSRLMQRYAMAGGNDNLRTCASLVSMAPGKLYATILVNGLQEGLAGSDVQEFPPELSRALRPYQNEFSNVSPVLLLKQGGKATIEKALQVIADARQPVGQRLSYIRAFGEVHATEVVPVLLKLVSSNQSSVAILKAALNTLQSYDEPAIGLKVLAAYPYQLRANPQVREAALSLYASRAEWAAQFLAQVGNGKPIHKDDVSIPLVQRMSLLNDGRVTQAVASLWPEIKLSTTEEKKKQIDLVTRLIKEGGGDMMKGKAIYTNRCGSCHRLFREGAAVGPDLTGYDRNISGDLLLNIVDPNAYIREGYLFYHVETKDGRNLTGKILERRGPSTVFQLINGETIQLSEAQIKTMKAQNQSLMPERLLDNLSEKEVKDLFAYLLKK